MSALSFLKESNFGLMGSFLGQDGIGIKHFFTNTTLDIKTFHEKESKTLLNRNVKFLFSDIKRSLFLQPNFDKETVKLACIGNCP